MIDPRLRSNIPAANGGRELGHRVVQHFSAGLKLNQIHGALGRFALKGGCEASWEIDMELADWETHVPSQPLPVGAVHSFAL
jgi:hypothetical protein